MPNTRTTMKTPGGRTPNAKALHLSHRRMKISSIPLVIKSSTESLLQKQRFIVLEKTRRTIVQFEKNVYGMRLAVMNPMAFGVDSVTVKGML